MTSLNMSGHVDGDFMLPSGVVRIVTKTEFNDDTGRMVETEVKRVSFSACVQPASMREIQVLQLGNERYVDFKKIYINSGDFSILDLKGYFEMLGGRWKPLSIDRRDSRMYCKIIVARLDL